MKPGIVGGIELHQIDEPARFQGHDQGRHRGQKMLFPVQNRYLDGGGLPLKFR